MLEIVEGRINVLPEFFTEDVFIIKSVADNVLNLFFQRSVEVSQWVNHDLLLLDIEGPIYFFTEVLHFFGHAFFFIADFVHDFFEFFNDLGFQSLDVINILFLDEKIVDLLVELFQGFLDDVLDLVAEADLDFPVELCLEFLSDLDYLWLNVRLCVFVVVDKNLLYDFLHFAAKVKI